MKESSLCSSAADLWGEDQETERVISVLWKCSGGKGGGTQGYSPSGRAGKGVQGRCLLYSTAVCAAWELAGPCCPAWHFLSDSQK